MPKKGKIHTPIITIYDQKPDLRKKAQPLVDLTITNPVIYFKKWWKNLLKNEGIDFRFRIKPLTAIAMAFVIAAAGFGVGKVTIPNTQSDLTAFYGKLHYSHASQSYYLLTTKSQAIKIVNTSNLLLDTFANQNVFVEGAYSDNLNTLNVDSISILD